MQHVRPIHKLTQLDEQYIAKFSGDATQVMRNRVHGVNYTSGHPWLPFLAPFCNAYYDNSDRVLGYIIYDERGHIKWLIVDPQHHGKGIGLKLLNSVMHPKAWLWVYYGNTPARKLYAKAGFITKESYPIDSHPARIITMCRPQALT